MASCIFCQEPFGANRIRSNEHILPLWLTEVLHGEGLIVQTWADPNTLESRTWTTKEPDFKARAVCEPCNSGWMSNLETDGKPFLTPMIQGRGCTLHDRGKELASFWALKTAMMLEYAQPAGCRSVPQSDYPELYASKTVLPNVWVWIGTNAFGGGCWAQTRTVGLESGEYEADGYASTLCVGHLVFQVMRIDIGEWESLEVGQQLRDALTPLWPTDTPVVWPPPAILTRDQVKLLGHTLRESGLRVTRPA
jgi:hypothetical protein